MRGRNRNKNQKKRSSEESKQLHFESLHGVLTEMWRNNRDIVLATSFLDLQKDYGGITDILQNDGMRCSKP